MSDHERVLVTGARGFIGRQALHSLSGTGEVHAVTSAETPTNAEGVKWHQSDLLDDAQIDALLASVRPTMLLHLAWYVDPRDYWTSDANALWSVAGAHLISEFARQGGRRAVIAGTCAEYDWGDGLCIEGETVVRPASPYAQAKHELMQASERVALETGMSLGWGRVFFLYGPHEAASRLVPSVTRSLLLGEPVACSDGAQVRDYLHVEDAADALVALLMSEVRGSVNIASGEGRSVAEVIGCIAGCLGGEDLIGWGALPGRADEAPSVVASVERLRREVGWEPRIRLEDGIARTVAWWSEELGVAQAEGVTMDERR